jgi:hypothetical protein
LTAERKVTVAAIPDSLLEFAMKNPITRKELATAAELISKPPSRKFPGSRLFASLLAWLGINQVS